MICGAIVLSPTWRYVFLKIVTTLWSIQYWHEINFWLHMGYVLLRFPNMENFNTININHEGIKL